MSEFRVPIATVVFEGDVQLFILQALSIDRLYDLNSLSEYTVILNGQDNSSLRRDILNSLQYQVSQDLFEKLIFIDFQDLLGDVERGGYYDQQALKLGVSRYFNDKYYRQNKYYLVLDSKNHFVRPSSIFDFFHEGKPIAPTQASSDYWKHYVLTSLKALGVDNKEHAEKMLPSITPYVMLTSEVVSLVNYLEEKFEAPLLPAMGKSGGTEFLLYYAHLVKLGKVSIYANQPLPIETLFTIWPQQPETLRRLVNRVTEADLPMFGLHRNRLPKLSDDQKLQIKALWQRHLLSPWEDGDWFMKF